MSVIRDSNWLFIKLIFFKSLLIFVKKCNIKFTILATFKCKTQYYICPHCCAPSPERFRRTKLKLSVYWTISHSPPCSPWNHHSTFCFCVWLDTSASGITQYVSFCDWTISLSILSSRLTHTAACSRISLFPKLNNVPLYIHAPFCPFIQWWTVRLFPLLGYEWCCHEHEYANLSSRSCFQVFWIYSEILHRGSISRHWVDASNFREHCTLYIAFFLIHTYLST